MALIRLWLGAELRRRWRVQLALALLIGLVGAVILTVAAGTLDALDPEKISAEFRWPGQ